MTDNGTQFTSARFKGFLVKNNVRHTCSAPGHPATNGTVERYVGFFNAPNKENERLTYHYRRKTCQISFLSYRTTPHPSTNEAPCIVLMKWQLRTRLSAVQPSLQLRKETEVFEKNIHSPKYHVGEPVYVFNLRQGPRWIPGFVVDVLNRNYNVQKEGIVTNLRDMKISLRSSCCLK